MKTYHNFFILLLICVNTFSQTKVISIEAEGNLESPNPLNCVKFSDVTSNHNPADIYNGLSKCIDQGNYDRATQYFALAWVYGMFDTNRVKDKTAHQAIIVLQMNTMESLSQEQQESLSEKVKEILSPESDKLQEVCANIKRIGPPSYYPSYMIQHGLSAFTKNNNDGNLVEGFNSEEAWQSALKTYINCNQ